MPTPHASHKLVFRIFNNPPDRDGAITLDDADLLRLRAVPKVVNKFRDAVGDRLSQPVLRGCSLEMQFIDAEGQPELFATDLHASLHRTAEQLEENGRRDEPLPYSDTVSQPMLVEPLKAIMQANQDCELEVFIVTEDGEHPVRKLQPEDFTQPIKDVPRVRTSTFKIQGTVRSDDGKGHFLIAQGDLRIRVPTNDSYWQLDRLLQSVAQKEWLVGTIRLTGERDWIVEPGAKIVQQGALDLSDTEGAPTTRP